MPTYPNSTDPAGIGYDDAYPYAYADADVRSRRRLLMIAAVAAVGLCVAFLAGYAARGADRTRASTPPTAAVTTATSPSAKATDSIPALTSAAPAPEAASVSGSAPLLRRNGDGVIVGYRDDQAGAVAAAGNYTASLYVQTNRTHARELAVLSGIAASPMDATRIAGDLSTEDAALAGLLGVASLQSDGVIAYGHPQGYRVESFSAKSATVDVLVAGGQGVADAPDDSGAAGQTFYEVDQVQLVWSHGDWALQDWSHLVENDGPQLGTVAAEAYQPFPIGQVS